MGRDNGMLRSGGGLYSRLCGILTHSVKATLQKKLPLSQPSRRTVCQTLGCYQRRRWEDR